jgi:hypothetical protein
MNALQIIQQKLKAPKSGFNAHGKYHYRSCEDVLEGIKPLLEETNSTIIISDSLVEIGGSVFVKATVELTSYPKVGDGQAINAVPQVYKSQAFAKHAETLAGMSASQITGATSSYARKYALNGLFAIDDTKDADAANTGKDETTPAKNLKPAKSANTPKPTEKKPKELLPGTKDWTGTLGRMKEGVTIETIKQFFTLSEENEKKIIAEATTVKDETK